MSEPAILWLDDPRCATRGIAGGKAAHLSRLAATHLVPHGFCVTANALQATVPGREAVLEKALRGAISAAYYALGQRCGVTQPPVAVRSSAVDEDSDRVSFAGQYETYLNVVGVDAVLQAVERCVAAAYAPRVVQYRERRGVAGGGSIAVLVQRLIEADVSAVAFSVHPVTADHGQVVITATWGLGESLVGGAATPDTYVVSKTDGTVLTCDLGAKQRMTIPIRDAQGGRHGTREVDAPRLLRRQRALDEEQVRQVGQLAAALESHMGVPVDVECSFAGGQLFLLQCRPITSLPAAPRVGERPTLSLL